MSTAGGELCLWSSDQLQQRRKEQKVLFIFYLLILISRNVLRCQFIYVFIYLPNGQSEDTGTFSDISWVQLWPLLNQWVTFPTDHCCRIGM